MPILALATAAGLPEAAQQVDPAFLIRALSIILGAAFIGGLAAQRLRQPPVVGYLIAGILLGPLVTGLSGWTTQVQLIANVTLVLLLFELGIELSLREILPMLRVALVGGLIQIGLTMAILLGVGRFLGWSFSTSLIMGAALAVSGSIIAIKILQDRAESGTAHGKVLVGLLIVQDLACIAILAFLASPQPDIPRPLAGLPGPLVAGGAAALILTAGLWLVPRLLREVARTRSREIMVLSTIAIAAGAAFFTHWTGTSLALGAFLAGLVVSESDVSHQVMSEALPFRDLFQALFFVAVGSLIGPQTLHQDFGTLGLLLAAVLVGKFAAGSIACLVFGYSGRVATLVGAGLAQVGEFTFMIGGLALVRHDVDSHLYQSLLATILLSSLAAPFLAQAAPRIYQWLSEQRWLPSLTKRAGQRRDLLPRRPLEGHAVILGLGRVGRVVGDALRRAGVQWVAVDYDLHQVLQARRSRQSIIYGDATKSPILNKAGVGSARLVVIALPEDFSARLAVERVRGANPAVPVLARLHRRESVVPCTAAGATWIVLPEIEAGLAMVAETMRQLGTNPKAAVAAARDEAYGTTEGSDRDVE